MDLRFKAYTALLTLLCLMSAFDGCGCQSNIGDDENGGYKLVQPLYIFTVHCIVKVTFDVLLGLTLWFYVGKKDSIIMLQVKCDCRPVAYVSTALKSFETLDTIYCRAKLALT